LRFENDALRATNEQLRNALGKLAERQRELVKAHADLMATFRRLTGKVPDKGRSRPLTARRPPDAPK
jgi:hypothetical protein